MNKGLTTRTIILIILGLLVLGIAGMLIFLGVGPFKEATSYDVCKAKLMTYCSVGGDWSKSGCEGAEFSGNTFCSGDCYKDYDCNTLGDEKEATINCCNLI